MTSKDSCNRALNKLIECKQRRLCDKCNFKIRCTMTNDKFIIKKLIDEHFGGIDNLNKVIEVQKNNLTDSYMIGLYNGLVTAKAILLNNNTDIKLADNTIKPYKFEELYDGMAVFCAKAQRHCLIGQVYDHDSKQEILLGCYDKNGFNDEWIEFEENRFYPVQYANEVMR